MCPLPGQWVLERDIIGALSKAVKGERELVSGTRIG
jgi:hypothetical protein